ncbi:MAG: hypothetical protein ACLGG0_03215 [Bacteriovoracia bacterium]
MLTSGMLDHYQYLFVGGILGELLALPFVGSYFKETQEILREQGARHVEIYFPNSYRSAEDNARDLAREVLRLYRLNGKKVILFCHSKACLEAVLALLDCPGLFKKSVHKIFCIQPPFKGSSLTEKQPGLARSRVVNRVYRASSKVWPALRSLKKDRYTARFENLAQTRPDLAALMTDKVVAVKGAKYQIDKVAWVLKISHGLLWQSGEETDGLLSMRDQEMPGFKVREVKIPMDHSDLFTSKNISNESLQFKTDILEKLLTLA